MLKQQHPQPPHTHKYTHTQIWVGKEVRKVDMGRIEGWVVCDQNSYKIINEGIHFLIGKKLK